MAAAAPVAEPDVVRCGKAARPGGSDAGGATVVHGAGAAADVVNARVAVGDHGVLRGARGERVDWLADEGEVCVGRLDPVHHLVVRHEVGCGLCRGPVSTSWCRAEG